MLISVPIGAFGAGQSRAGGGCRGGLLFRLLGDQADCKQFQNEELFSQGRILHYLFQWDPHQDSRKPLQACVTDPISRGHTCQGRQLLIYLGNC